MADLRDFLTDRELEDIKERIVRAVVTAHFLSEKEETNDDGEKYYLRTLRYEFDKAVKEATLECVREFVGKTVEETVKPRVQQAAEMMTNRFVQQAKEISEKINWYWSIK